MTTVNWATSSLQFSGTQRVYVRQTWADAWAYQGNIWCGEATWSLLPSMPVAQFELDYGKVLPHGGSSWTTQSKLAIGGWYVKVEFDAADGTLTWIGYIDDSVDEQGGISDGIASGRQRWVAYGMPQVLAYEYLTRCRWDDNPNSTVRWSGSAINFNDRGKPNRSRVKPGSEASHVFSPTAAENINAFSPWEAAKHWSTFDIVEYIEATSLPLDESGAAKILFRIDGKSLLPDWDKPTIETEGKSVLSILQELINPNRLLQMSTGIDSSTTPNTVVLKIHSLASSDIALPDSKTHYANTNVLSLVAAGAQDTRITVQGSETATVHQVVVKGAKQESVATFSVGDDEGLIQGWTTTQQDAYDAGASAEGGYSSKSDEEKREANQVVRAKPSLADVFRTLVINPDWDFAVDGAVGYLFSDGLDRYYPWWNAINIAASLPYKENVDYTGFSLPSDDDAKPEYRPPYVLFKRPASSPAEYIQGEKMANPDGNPSFSIESGLSKDNQGITLDVVGANQHAIAKTDFTPLPVDDSEVDDGDWDYIDAKFTLSWTEDRYAEFSYPEAEDLPARDAIRRKLVYAGDSYKRILVKDGTAVDVDNDGALKESATGYLHNDDEGKLESIAMVAAAWFLTPRQILRLSSSRPSSLPLVGQLLTTVNASTPHAATINSVVSEIRLSMTRDERSVAANYSLVTATGELNPLAFIPTRGEKIV